MKWTTKEIDTLIKYYGKIPAKDMPINRTPGAIRIMASYLGLKGKTRHNNVNDNFFESVNNISSYYAGIIAADGCIQNDRKSKILTLSMTDKEILDSFKRDIKYTGTIKTAIRYKNDKKCKDIYTIRIYSDKICDDLFNIWSITSKKSYTLQPPNILNEDCRLSFIIGLIDGDGTIRRRSDSDSPIIAYCGTYSMVKWFCDNLGIKNKITYSKISVNNHSVRINGRNAYPILKKLYEVKTPHKLSRKWDLAKYFINKYDKE